MSRLKLTKRTVDKIPLTDKGQAFYRDLQLPGFGLCVGTRSKSYFIQRNVNGRTVRTTIGRHGAITPEEARREALELLSRMVRGDNPNLAREVSRVTLRTALEDYLKARRELRPRTRHDYARVMNSYLSDWLDRPLVSITGQMVAERHERLGSRNGRYVANTTMRVLRAIYNFALAAYEDLPPNPVLRLSRTRSWYREERRRGVIRPHELSAWYGAVMELESELARDYLRLVMFTGLRRSEALRLRWAEVDLVGRTLLVPETKNREPLMLPLSNFLHELLSQRQCQVQRSEWVFPGDGSSGHLEEPKKFIRRVRAASGVDFTLHDLRRTFITIAESLDIPAYALKRLLNHKDRSDVTAGYIVINVDRLRTPIQKITDYILRAVNENCKPFKENPKISIFTRG
jgi:integrase